MRRWGAVPLLGLLVCALAGSPAAAQRGAAYCNIIEVKSEQLSNGVRVTIVADGELNWDLDSGRLMAEGALECHEVFGPWGRGVNCMPTERFTRLPFRLMNARSKLGSAFVAVGKYPVSHVEISIPEWAVEGVGLEVDVVNYLAWFTGEGELFRGRYDLYFYHSDDRRQIIVAWVSDRFPPPPPPTTPAGLPAELEVTSGPAGLSVRAVNAKLAEVANAIAAQTGFAVSTPADSELRVSLRLRDLPAAEVIGAIARGCGLSAGQRPDGSWTVAAGVGASGGYEVATTRRVELHYVRAVEALDLLPNFLLQYLHVDGEGNAIIVTGPPWMCERVAADLAKLDAAPAQVALEVTAVEYSSEAALARSLQLDNRLLGSFATSLTTLTGDLGVLVLPGLSREWDLLLNQREVNSAVRVTSRSTVRVLNGHTCRIFAGQQRNIIIQQIEEGVTANILPVDIGTSLQLQPRLGEGDEAVLHVTVKINTLKSTDPESGLPVVSLRSADVTARVKDGETIAVAGLELAEESRESRRVPILSSLPLIGGLFRAPSRSQSETHLAVFITPHVIRGAEASPSSPGPTDRAQSAAQGGSRHG